MPDTDLVPLALAGHVVMRDTQTDAVILDSKNMVVNAMFELLIRGLTGEDAITRMHAVQANGLPITKGLRALGTPVLNILVERSGDLAPVKSLDSAGIRSICTWTGLLRPSGTVTYDALGLVSTTGLLGAAVAFQPVTLNAGSVVSVQWTISLRGS